jgi:hypothetical protein
VTVEVRNASGKERAARTTLDLLVQQGFKPGKAVDDARGRVFESEVRYAPGKIEAAKLLQGRISPIPNLVADPELTGADVAVVLGTNFVSLVALPTGSSEPAPVAGPAPAPSGDESQINRNPTASPEECG